MANIHIKSEEQRRCEEYMLRATGNRPTLATREQREYAECAVRRTTEALKEMEAKSHA